MTVLKKKFIPERSQYLVLSALSAANLILTALLFKSGEPAFQRFFGAANPILVFLGAILTGTLVLSTFLTRGWFVIFEKKNLREFPRYAAPALAFGAIIILVDWLVVFPADMNLRFPASLLFYPAIGFLVEVVFHLLPLGILATLSATIFRNTNETRLIWICMLFVALFEPAYQAIAMAAAGRYSAWVVGYVGLHVFGINLVQLIVFKRYDFLSMYLFRMVYYLIWHIAWGNVRLALLF